MKKLKKFYLLIKKFYLLIKEIFYILEWSKSFIINFLINGKIKSKLRINKKIIIIGNGPSLKKVDFSESKYLNCDFLCVNQFALDEKKFYDLKPKYYCMIDPVYFDDNDVEHKEMKRKLFDILNNVNWKLNIVTFSCNKINFSNKNIRILNINNNLYKGNFFNLKYYLFKKNIACPVFQNVINAAIYFSITYKAKEIYLYGVENDWHRELYVDKKNNVIRKLKHFYGDEDINLTQRGDIAKGDLDVYFYYYYITLNTYKNLSKYAHYMNTHIYNCVENSYIDTFCKRKF